jgi:Domain of unknown function (DUF4383)
MGGMAHIPVNHHLQPLYRVLAVACGVYVLVFGLAGVVQSRGLDTFAMHGLPWVLGLKANRAFSIASIVAGIVIIAGGLVGRNLDHWVNLIGGIGFLSAGMAMMTLLRTDLNIFGFTMTTCVVSFVIGVVLFTAGLYGKTGSADDVLAEESFRHGGHLDADPTA